MNLSNFQEILTPSIMTFKIIIQRILSSNPTNLKCVILFLQLRRKISIFTRGNHNFVIDRVHVIAFHRDNTETSYVFKAAKFCTSKKYAINSATADGQKTVVGDNIKKNYRRFSKYFSSFFEKMLWKNTLFRLCTALHRH